MGPILKAYKAYQKLEKRERENAAFECKRKAERAVIKAAVAWRQSVPPDLTTYSEKQDLVDAVDRLIALG